MGWTTPKTWSAGETLTAANFNTHIRDNENALMHLIVRKPSDESVTSSAVVQADNDLILPVGANEVWEFRFNLLVVAPAAGDFQFRFTFPSGTFSASLHSINTSNTFGDVQLGDNTSPTATIGVGITSATLPDFLPIHGVHVNSGTPGNVVLEWSQAVSDGTATTVKANSTLWGCKLA